MRNYDSHGRYDVRSCAAGLNDVHAETADGVPCDDVAKVSWLANEATACTTTTPVLVRTRLGSWEHCDG